MLDKPGFPVYFLCPNCNHLHTFPKQTNNAHFQDPGKASQEFKLAFAEMAKWEHTSPFDLLYKANPVMATDFAFSLFEEKNG